MEFIYNSFNIVFYLLVFSLLFYSKYINSSYFFYCCFSIFSPFIFNGFLFQPDFMSDQFRYLASVISFRDFVVPSEPSGSVYYSSFLYSLAPIPFVVDIFSLALFNRFLMIVLSVWLYRKKFIGFAVFLFLNFYPDIILYSSVALRDVLVIFFMLLSGCFFVTRKYILSFCFIIPLFFIKEIIFYLFCVLFFVHFVFFNIVKTNYLRLILALIILLFLFYLLFLFVDQVLGFINPIRLSFYFENNPAGEWFHQSIDSYSELVLTMISGGYYFLLKPFVFEAQNPFQVIQSIMNLFIFFILLYLIYRAFLVNYIKCIFWSLSFYMFFSIYDMLVFNFGTASRYRTALVVSFVVFLVLDVWRRDLFFYSKLNDVSNKTTASA